MNGTQWRTVCTGSQELAGAVCSQMGYLLESNVYRINDITLSCTYLESSVAALNSFPPGAFPEYRLDCDCAGGGCTVVKANCTNSFMELGVVCKTLRTDMRETTQLPNILCTTNIESESYSTCADNSTTLIAGIGVLVALLLAVSVGWIVSCVILLRRGLTVHKQQ